MTAERILALARVEIGVKESPANSNNVKYNTAYYGKAVSGDAYPWCCAFIWWLFQQGGEPELFYKGKKTASCTTLLTRYRQDGQEVKNFQPGDLVFYNFSGGGNPQHIGIVESATSTTVTSIEGNTGAGNDANGGAVMRRTRNKKYVVGIARPNYEEDDMDIKNLTDEQLLELWNRTMAVLSKQPPAKDWGGEDREWAEKNGIITGDKTGNKQYKKPVTREELAVIVHRLHK